MEAVRGVALGQRLKGKRGDGIAEAVKSECGLRQEWDSVRWGTCSRQRVASAVTGDVCTKGLGAPSQWGSSLLRSSSADPQLGEAEPHPMLSAGQATHTVAH